MILLTSSAYIKSHTALNDNTYDKMIVPALERAQDIDLTECLGVCLVKALMQMVSEGSISYEANAQYKMLLDDYVQPFLAYTSMSNIVLEIGQVMGNGGVDTITDEHRQSLTFDERGQLKDYWKHHADSYRGRMIEFLKEVDIPEWRAFCRCGSRGSESAASSPVWLGGARGKILTKRCCGE